MGPTNTYGTGSIKVNGKRATKYFVMYASFYSERAVTVVNARSPTHSDRHPG